MSRKRVKILHVVKDSIHSKTVFSLFENNSLFDNSCVYIAHCVWKQSWYLSEFSTLTVLNNRREIKDYLEKGYYDVILFHSMDIICYDFFDFIPDDKIVIWWQWGYDIYSSLYALPAIIPIEHYKSQTKRHVNRKNYVGFGVLKKVYRRLFYYGRYKKLRSRMLRRVDYYQPVLPIEYKLMIALDGFHAKEFYFPTYAQGYKNLKSELKPENGKILFGNSASYENNHIDVWNDISSYLSEYHKIIMPISYGDSKYASFLSKTFNSNGNIILIKKLIPQNEYFDLLDTCSYAVFGVLIQHAMGNIYRCLSHGIKVFLYKDSIVYKYLIDNGYCVFAIDDITNDSFNVPLNILQIEQNLAALERETRYIESVSADAVSDIVSHIF